MSQNVYESLIVVLEDTYPARPQMLLSHQISTDVYDLLIRLLLSTYPPIHHSHIAEDPLIVHDAYELCISPSNDPTSPPALCDDTCISTIAWLPNISLHNELPISHPIADSHERYVLA